MGFYDRNRGCAFHPGGYGLTKYAVAKCGFPKGSSLLDVGCGAGGNIERLRADFDCHVTGLEPSLAMSGGRADIIRADAENTGLPADSFDGVLFECVLSLCEEPANALAEACRVMRRGGRLIISDLYADSCCRCDCGPVARIFSEREIQELTGAAGFRTIFWEDRRDDLTDMALQMIMEGLADEMCDMFALLRRIKCRCFLLIAEKV